jgi:hypothetical protein
MTAMTRDDDDGDVGDFASLSLFWKKISSYAEGR